MHFDLAAFSVGTLFIASNTYASEVVQQILDSQKHDSVREVKLHDEENSISYPFLKIYPIFEANALVLCVVSGANLNFELAMLLSEAINKNIQFQRLVLLETVFSLESEQQSRKENQNEAVEMLHFTKFQKIPESLRISELALLLGGASGKGKKFDLFVYALENYLGCTYFSAANLADLCRKLSEGGLEEIFGEGIAAFDQAKFVAKCKAKGYKPMYV